MFIECTTTDKLAVFGWFDRAETRNLADVAPLHSRSGPVHCWRWHAFTVSHIWELCWNLVTFTKETHFNARLSNIANVAKCDEENYWRHSADGARCLCRAETGNSRHIGRVDLVSNGELGRSGRLPREGRVATCSGTSNRIIVGKWRWWSNYSASNTKFANWQRNKTVHVKLNLIYKLTTHAYSHLALWPNG